MANINELMEGWGFGKQTTIGTANSFLKPSDPAGQRFHDHCSAISARAQRFPFDSLQRFAPGQFHRLGVAAKGDPFEFPHDNRQIGVAQLSDERFVYFFQYQFLRWSVVRD
jgi:hypothetical protein